MQDRPPGMAGGMWVDLNKQPPVDASWKCANGDSLEKLHPMIDEAEREHLRAKGLLLSEQLKLTPLEDEELRLWLRLKNLKTRLAVWKEAWSRHTEI